MSDSGSVTAVCFVLIAQSPRTTRTNSPSANHPTNQQNTKTTNDLFVIRPYFVFLLSYQQNDHNQDNNGHDQNQPTPTPTATTATATGLQEIISINNSPPSCTLTYQHAKSAIVAMEQVILRNLVFDVVLEAEKKPFRILLRGVVGIDIEGRWGKAVEVG